MPQISKYKMDETVFAGERALLFRDGQIVEELGPGRHKRWGRGWSLSKYGTWPTTETVAGQEILTGDVAPVRLSVVAVTGLSDLKLAYEAGSNFRSLLHVQIQSALRADVAGLTLDQVMESRDGIAERLTPAVREACEKMGYSLRALYLRDLVISGELKKAYHDRLTAQLQATANLERARGEAATLRSLANTARLLEEHPGLSFLRLLSQIEKHPATTIVIGNDTLQVLPKSKA